ncbi:AI-2E family transporter [Crenothrix sp.]|uniref:AI-2E family transporter n=1 Tax=Crenothrix sp. TaxID=3100433 RepID=UPI00374D57C4
MINNQEVRARLIGGFVLLLLGAWVLHSFLALLIWAVVLAITTWPIYRRLLNASQFHGNVTWVALGLTLLMGAVILVPLGYGFSRLIDEAQSLGQLAIDIKNTGIPVPTWLKALPVLGDWASGFWMKSVGSPAAAEESLHWLSTGGAITYTKSFASQLMHRFLGFLLTLVVLFFVYRHGDSLGRQILAISRKLFGETGIHYATHAAAAVRATVNGLVLVGLGEGLLLGVGYAFAGFSHPAILGALTGVFAMIPFAAKLIVLSCVLVLVAEGSMGAGVALAIFGVVVILLADNYVRPLLIGGSVQLPFIWTLLGIFGGLENFGLLGLFLGPTLMAVLMSIWRDWTEDMNKH